MTRSGRIWSHGAKFVIYSYAFSLLIVSFKRSSGIFFIRPGAEPALWTRALPYSLIAFLFGWWGIPHGIIYTFWSLGSNFTGGKDVTSEVLATMSRH